MESGAHGPVGLVHEADSGPGGRGSLDGVDELVQAEELVRPARVGLEDPHPLGELEGDDQVRQRQHLGGQATADMAVRIATALPKLLRHLLGSMTRPG